ncbi:MAG: hypothetical protein R3C24_15935 [Cyanobacteriota/Melainabacteria group bacterium]
MALVLAVSGSVSELRAQGLVLDPPRTQVIRAIDRDGTILFESREFANLGGFSEGLAPFAILNKIQMGRTWGYIYYHRQRVSLSRNTVMPTILEMAKRLLRRTGDAFRLSIEVDVF